MTHVRNIFIFFLFFIRTLNAEIDPLKEKLDQILNKVHNETKIGILIINPMSGDTIYSLNPTLALIPASNTKLFTTAVALSLLGPDFKISTMLYTNDNNINDGIINGDLYLKGYGNGNFSIEDLEQLAAQIKEKQIWKITGNIVGDDSYFDEEYLREDGIEDETSSVKLPPISALILDRNQIVAYKKIKRKRRYYTKAYYKYLENPPIAIAELLRNELLKNDIIVDGGFDKGVTPSGALHITGISIQLKEFIKQINKRSDNYLAECLFKIIGAEISGEQGTAFNSAQAIHQFLTENDVYSEGTKIVDGSGISRFNSVSTGSIVGLLEKIYLDLKTFEYFYNSLSIAGVDGTLGRRMIGSAAEYNFRGKTGTLGVSSSVSGYLKIKNGDDLIISIIFEFNKGNNKLYRNIENQIIETLAEYENYPAN
jgi:D-alanyl-D-alanine carboxypeptidase/D-alanyl-D-alanine-endopeptidase (penicillin-binding protein 4)